MLDRVFKNPDALNEDVAALMQPPLATVDVTDSLDQVFADSSGPNAAVVVAAGGRPAAILTRSDLLDYLAHQRSQVNGWGLAPGHPAGRRACAAVTRPTGSSAAALPLRPLPAGRRRRPSRRSAPRRARQRASTARPGASAPSAIATSGFTYWCVTTCEIGAFRSSHAYAVKPISEPTMPR